jgi:hypothetical protein
MKTYGGCGSIAPSFLTLALAGGECSASRPRRLYARGKSLCCPLDRRLGGPRSHSGSSAVEKNPLTLSGIELQLSSLLPVAILTELSRLI